MWAVLTRPNPRPPVYAQYDPPTPPTAYVFDGTGTQVATAPMTQLMNNGTPVPGVYFYTYATLSGQAGMTLSGWVDGVDDTGDPFGSVYVPTFSKATPIAQVV